MHGDTDVLRLIGQIAERPDLHSREETQTVQRRFAQPNASVEGEMKPTPRTRVKDQHGSFPSQCNWAQACHSDRSLAAMATRGLTLRKLHFKTCFCLGGLQHMCFMG